MKVLSILSYMWRPMEYQFCITASASGTINVAAAAAAAAGASFSFAAPAAAALRPSHPLGWLVTSCFSLQLFCAASPWLPSCPSVTLEAMVSHMTLPPTAMLGCGPQGTIVQHL